MATLATAPDECILDVLREQIITTFDKIITEITTRRDQLLSEIDDRRREFEFKNSAMVESVKELEEIIINLEKMSVKQDVAMKRQQDTLVSINSEIVTLKTDINRKTQLKYSCSLDQLIQQIKKFGEITDTASNPTLVKSKYCRKLTAVKNIKISECCGSSMKLYIDPSKEYLYVICPGRKIVLIYNANDFKFVQKFGDTRYPLKCVTSSKEFIYAISTDEIILQYKSSNLSFVAAKDASFSQSNTFNIGIGVSDENQVFLLDNYGFIEVFDRDLNLKETIKLDLEKYSEPNSCRCLSMITRENRLYILLASKILLFVPFGDWKNISCYFKNKEGQIPYVKNPSAFCIDPAGNVIVADSDSDTSSIQFLSPEGDLIHTIGKSTVGSDIISGCSDIIFDKDSIIVACRDSNGFHIRLY